MHRPLAGGNGAGVGAAAAEVYARKCALEKDAYVSLGAWYVYVGMCLCVYAL